jgi:hypothetical protein
MESLSFAVARLLRALHAGRKGFVSLSLSKTCTLLMVRQAHHDRKIDNLNALTLRQTDRDIDCQATV